MIFETEQEMVMVSDFMNNAKFEKLGVKDCTSVLNAVNVVNDAARKFINEKQEKNEAEKRMKDLQKMDGEGNKIEKISPRPCMPAPGSYDTPDTKKEKK